jgi:alkylation response protein AidB-like acyl-CoA dehydrogenase
MASEETQLQGLDQESRQMVLDTIAQLRKRLLTKEKILQYDREEIFPEETIREMLGPEIGLQLLMLPEAYDIATGKSLVAYAVTEPDAGSNVVAIKTKADPVTNDAGDIIGYKINGSKQFISTGLYADFITVLAGATFFIMEKGTEGYTPGKGEKKHGIRASNTSPLTFSDAFVPVENLIGGVAGQGFKHASKVFGYTRLIVAAMALGSGEAAVEIAINYAKERIQFKAPLSEKQGYTHKLIIPHVVRLAAAEAFIEETAERLDSGEKNLEVEGSIAKLFTTESANKAAEDAIQALGGYGYIAE